MTLMTFVTCDKKKCKSNFLNDIRDIHDIRDICNTCEKVNKTENMTRVRFAHARMHIHMCTCK